MTELKNETKQQELECSEPNLTFKPERPPSTGTRSSGAQKGFWIWLQTFLKALCSRKKQVSAQRKKSAQDWRNETQSKNPFWGGGF